MSPKDRSLTPQHADEWRRLGPPMLKLEGPEASTRMGRTVGEGLNLPAVDAIAAVRVDEHLAASAKRQTIQWLRDVLRAEWLPEDLDSRLVPLYDAIDGQDAFVAVWDRRDRPFHAIITKRKIHIVTRLAGTQAAGEKPPADVALDNSFQVLNLARRPDAAQWDIRPFEGLTLGYVDTGFAREWHESLLFLTDGRSVKFSMEKFKNRTSEMERISPDEKPTPWFPRETSTTAPASPANR